jgi:hypothetical protein
MRGKKIAHNVLYAPTRYIANGGKGATADDALADWPGRPQNGNCLEEMRVQMEYGRHLQTMPGSNTTRAIFSG